MKKLTLLGLIALFTACSKPDIPRPDIDESINIEQTFANTYWQRIGGGTFMHTNGKYKEDLSIDDSPAYTLETTEYKYIGDNSNICVNYLDTYNNQSNQSCAFAETLDLNFDIEKRRLYGWRSVLYWGEDIHQEIIKLSNDTIAVYEAYECIKDKRYHKRKYSVWAQFTPNAELQERLNSAIPATYDAFCEFDQQR